MINISTHAYVQQLLMDKRKTHAQNSCVWMIICSIILANSKLLLMQDNLRNAINTHSSLFQSILQQHLSNNLTLYLISILSNLLLFDFFNRSDSIQKTPKKYIEDCANNLSDELSHQVITDESFSNAMSLFVTAISPKLNINDRDKISQKKTQSQMVDTITSMYFSDITGQSAINIKSVITAMLQNQNYKNILDFISGDAKTFKEIVSNSFEKYKSNNEAISHAINNTSYIASAACVFKHKTSYLQQISSKIFFVTGLFVGISASVATLGIASPFAMIPITALSLRYIPKAGAKMGEGLAMLSSTIQTLKGNLEDKKQSILTNNVPSISKTREQAKNNRIDKETLKDIQPIIKVLNKTETQDIHNTKQSEQKRKKTNATQVRSYNSNLG